MTFPPTSSFLHIEHEAHQLLEEKWPGCFTYNPDVGCSYTDGHLEIRVGLVMCLDRFLEFECLLRLGRATIGIYRSDGGSICLPEDPAEKVEARTAENTRRLYSVVEEALEYLQAVHGLLDGCLEKFGDHS